MNRGRASAPLRLALLLLAGCAGAPARPGRHGTDVAWEDWTPATFARARAEGKLVLVNVAAGWCHWCHVMDERTFRDPDLVALVHERFVPIRVDADARPDVAERFQRWGWPANAVLTPDARPVREWRGYQEAPVYTAALAELAEAHAAGRDVGRAARPAARPASDLAQVTSALRAQLDSYYDAEQHGWGKRQKYPLAAAVEHAFLRAEVRPEEAAWRERALATLRAQAALLDPVWGGLFQYSDDGTWGGGRHWEKIVPIQTGAIESYCLAYRVTGDASWLEPARAIHRYLIEHLRAPDGAFFASQDADPPGGTGAAFYALDDAGRRATAAPRIDRSVYADLNGLIIVALCRLHEVTGERPFLEEALAAAEALLRTHRAGDAWKHAPSLPDAPLFLADQVAMGQACLELSLLVDDVAARERWQALALESAGFMVEWLRVAGGGFRAATTDPIADERLPWRDNALAARFLLRLHAVTEDRVWLATARRVLAALVADPEAVDAWGRLVGEALVALEEAALPAVTVKVAPGSPGLAGVARRTYAPRLVVRGEGAGAAAALVCGEGLCSPPIAGADALPGAIREFAASLR